MQGDIDSEFVGEKNINFKNEILEVNLKKNQLQREYCTLNVCNFDFREPFR